MQEKYLLIADGSSLHLSQLNFYFTFLKAEKETNDACMNWRMIFFSLCVLVIEQRTKEKDRLVR